ncbi:hypothetical protein XTG29_01598 [Xanthomonas translucens pv. graminis ART-Xtg29]|uniref:hypothetical protein n=1 Tax=Xanthomonas graminis TaxID=3390026 RepID=UPI00029CA4D4|nr:hypothetical protein [Xanthomonas translucens]EKU25422.1 hypothetical protein XTG29_01598 [Xanthomonas translucens pv. graminis ART-Xtg29]
MAIGTRLMVRLYLPPALLVLGGFLVAELLLHFASGAHAQAIARMASLLSLAGLLGGHRLGLGGQLACLAPAALRGAGGRGRAGRAA